MCVWEDVFDQLSLYCQPNCLWHAPHTHTPTPHAVLQWLYGQLSCAIQDDATKGPGGSHSQECCCSHEEGEGGAGHGAVSRQAVSEQGQTKPNQTNNQVTCHVLWGAIFCSALAAKVEAETRRLRAKLEEAEAKAVSSPLPGTPPHALVLGLAPPSNMQQLTHSEHTQAAKLQFRHPRGIAMAQSITAVHGQTKPGHEKKRDFDLQGQLAQTRCSQSLAECLEERPQWFHVTDHNSVKLLKI